MIIHVGKARVRKHKDGFVEVMDVEYLYGRKFLPAKGTKLAEQHEGTYVMAISFDMLPEDPDIIPDASVTFHVPSLLISEETIAEVKAWEGVPFPHEVARAEGIRRWQETPYGAPEPQPTLSNRQSLINDLENLYAQYATRPSMLLYEFERFLNRYVRGDH